MSAYQFDPLIQGSDEMAREWVFGPNDAADAAALRQFYPELQSWSDAHLICAWGNYSQSILAVGFADVYQRDAGFLAYLYVRQEAPGFDFGGTGLFMDDVWALGDTVPPPWVSREPLAAPFKD